MDRPEQTAKTLEMWSRVCPEDNAVPVVMINRASETKYHISMPDDMDPKMIIDSCIGAFNAVPHFRKPFGDFMAEFIGATGSFPQGKLVEHDEGEIRMAIGVTKDNVIIDFGKKTAWLGMPKQEALAFGRKIIEMAENL
jgi:hypothetical protein